MTLSATSCARNWTGPNWGTDDMPDDGDTTKMRTVALDVCEQQARTCGVQMRGIEKQGEQLIVKLEKLTETVQNLTTTVEVLKQRWQLFSVIASIVGLVGVLVGIIGSIR